MSSVATAFLAVMVLNLIFVATFSAFWLRQRTFHGVNLWAWGMGLILAGHLSVFFQKIPGISAFIVITGNVMIVLGAYLVVRGTDRFHGRHRIRRWERWGLAVAAVLWLGAFVWFAVAIPDVNVRIILVSAILVLLALYAIYILILHWDREAPVAAGKHAVFVFFADRPGNPCCRSDAYRPSV